MLECLEVTYLIALREVLEVILTTGKEIQRLAFKRKCYRKIMLCVCLDVNQAGTNHNHCTQRLVILHAQTY